MPIVKIAGVIGRVLIMALLKSLHSSGFRSDPVT